MKNTPANSPLRIWKLVSGAALLGLCLTFVGCGTADLPPGQTQKGNSVPAGPFTLTVNTIDTPDEVDFTDNTGKQVGSITGTTSFTLTYAAGTQVALSIAAPTGTPPLAYLSGLEIFNNWIGCQASVGPTCVITMTSNATVTAKYTPQVSFTLQPQVGGPNGCCAPPYFLLIGTGEQIYLHPTFLNNQSNGNVTWSVVSSDPAFSPGTIDSGGNYVSPYPAPPFVTITIVSQFDPLSTVSVVINLGAPSAVGGPALTVDTSAVTHPISPLIYGVNNLGSSETSLGNFVPTADRWGGYTDSRYNYLLDLTNTGGANSKFYETVPNTNTAFPDTSAVNSQIALDQSGKIASVITVPIIGYVTQSPDSTKRAFACGFSIAKYGPQTAADPNHPDCGNGVSTANNNPYINNSSTATITIGTGSNAVTLTGGPTQVTNPADTSIAIDPSFDADWVKYLVGKFGNAASGGVAVYELDDEPEYWIYNHNDLHPTWTTYDDVTNKGIAYATAIKGADPTAAVGGPTISGYYYYTDSLADQYLGYASKPKADQLSHGGTLFLPYYLQQMKAASATAGVRLLDYLDVHASQFTSGYSGQPGGNTTVQAGRENAVRLLYDPTYADANNNNYDLIPYLQGLVTANYPGTKTAITDYSFGGEESISGAVAEAEALAIFGAQGLDLATITGSQGPITNATYMPAQTAFNFFLNYDGAGSKFGDGSLNTNSTFTAPDPVTGLPTTTSGTSQLSIYAAERSSDGKITVLVFNHTYQDETSSVALTTTATSAKVFQYSGADLTKISSGTTATVTNGSVSVLFPAQSITLLEF